MNLEIRATVSAKIGFASHQNSVPVLRELELVNAGPERFEGLELELSADPPFLETKTWKIDELRVGDSTHITDRDVKLRAGFLADLTESVTGKVILKVTRAGVVLAEVAHPLEILAKNQWGGGGSMPELLPAFCMPNDPAVDQVLKAASEVLRRAGKPSGLDGYESKSRTRVWELVSAVWSAIGGMGLSYALPPASFEDSGQKVRSPGAIADGRVATCLDTALLFAAVLEQAGLHPVLILTKGHAFAGAWLQPQEFPQLITEEAAAVRKRIELQEMVVFETTLVSQPPVVSFSKGVEKGRRQLTDEEFVMAVDIRRARMQRIKPLAVASGVTPEVGVPTAPVVEALEAAPNLPVFDVEVTPENLTASDRVELWQRKLLDLTTRNRLLNLPEKSKSVPLLCPDPAILEDLLADGKKIKVVALPDLQAAGRDTALYEQQNLESLQEKYARDMLERGEVVSTLPKDKLETELIDLYRKSRSDMDEGGANTLFLAVGFLRWRKSAEDPRVYRAPLLLIPVQLERKSALSNVTMRMHEDEPRFNLTLLELLRQDFELRIPALEGPLPLDESGVDVIKVWNLVRQAVRDIAGFEVSSEMVLGTFSFAKYLMWKDLVDRKEHLMRSPVVKHLMDRQGEGFDYCGEFPRAEELDQIVDPADLFTPLPADSSQLAAVVASANDCNFVLDGPPGTGKSQTIANMIAHNLALGRRVLFVAEKMAALDVVYRRLAAVGLGEFCLELHSHKTSKVDVLKQLGRAWDARDSAQAANEWQRDAAETRRLRDRLNALVACLHKKRSNGLTLHQAIGRVVRDGTDAQPRLMWAAETPHTEEDLAALRDAARRLDLNAAATSSAPGGFLLIERKEWTNGWQEAVAASAAALPATIDALALARDELLALARVPVTAETEEAMVRLSAFVDRLLDTHGMDVSFAFAADVTSKVAAARQAAGLLAEYEHLESLLSVTYAPEAARRIQCRQVEADWTAAGQKFWFLATMAKKKVARALAEQGGTAGVPDVVADLPKLRRIREILEAVDKLTSSLQGVEGWAGLQSDLARMTKVVEVVEQLRAGISGMASTPEHLVELRTAVRALVVEANELLGAEGRLASSRMRFREVLARFREGSLQFRELCGTPPGMTLTLPVLRESALAITANKARLKAWCDWRRAREDAISLQLMPMVKALESGAVASGQVQALFEIAYARWFAADVIDSEPVLRSFVEAEHVSDIEAYRKLDDRLSKLCVKYIRAQLCSQIPSKNEVSKKDGFGVLKHELQKQRRHKPLRQLAVEMGDALPKLAPCMLMSPLSIAQYLPPEQALFDLVIFDEASQITPWDAVGSIARGRQVVIAGDPRQMPPTSFFNRAADESEEEDVEGDMESILDECLAAGVPSHRLTWHYRSRHESLIAFSNHRYYDSSLITFPAAVTRPSEVKWVRVQGVYAKGKGRINQAEAEQMVAETVRRLTDPAFLAAGKSLAIVTLNAEQQKLVEDLLDKARRRQPEIERYFGDECAEPVVVKNLETVQGDERDLIMLGIGYGPTEPGANNMSMNFGPLNREGGWRRLNVAVTRARQEMMVFTSFDPTMIDLNRTSARAVTDLKHFLEFADHGPQALAEVVKGSVGGYDSPFEEAVARRLTELGWQVVPQIGVSRYRIDLGIVHPDRAGDYLAGVECDGASYHSAATARDRDKVRASVLQGLGWKLLRVWSTEWWVDKEEAVQRLHAAIEALLKLSRAEWAEKQAQAQAAERAKALESVVVTEVQVSADSAVEEKTAGNVVAPSTLEPAEGVYQAAEFTLFAEVIRADQFHEPDYDLVLQSLVAHVVAIEGPIMEDLLVQRMVRAHGFTRSGRLIRERVLEIVDDHHVLRADPLGGRFVWSRSEVPEAWRHYRLPASEGDVRSIDEICFEELRAAAQAGRGVEPAEIARLFGIKRLLGANRGRLDAALALLAQK